MTPRGEGKGTDRPFLTVVRTSAALALAVGAWMGVRGVTTSGFSLTLGAGQTLALLACLFVGYLILGTLICFPLLLSRRSGASRTAMRRLLRAGGSVTLWFFLGITFLPLKGSELSVKAGKLTTLQLNAIGLGAVLVGGAVIAWIVAAAALSATARVERRAGGRGKRTLGAGLAGAAVVVLVAGSALRAGELTRLHLPENVSAPDVPRVVIVGVDGCDWEMLAPLVQEGRLPAFASLMERGCYGPLRSVEPLVSPVIWTTLATGKTADRHGIPGFVNEAGMPVNATMVRSAPIWDIVSAYGLPVGVVGWYVTWPAGRVNGSLVSDRMHSLLRGPTQIAESMSGRSTNERLAAFGRFTFDPGYKRLPRTDRLYRENRIVDEPLRWGYLRDRIYGDIMVALARISKPKLAVVYYRGVDFVQHFFWRYADPAPFGDVSPDERERFGDVVANYYVYQDGLLAQLLDALGDDVNVILVSDHGFRPRLERKPGMPELTGEHDVIGVLIAAGPAFKSGGRVDGATILDVAPTALAVMGLPIAEDMDGRPLTEIIRDEHLARFPIAFVPSYEGVLPRRATNADPGSMDESIKEQLKSLGYID
jgi:hypothetical protein